MRAIRYFCLVLFVAAGIQSASAFALLGPFAPWMTAELSYQDGYSIGGPMNIGEGYRWNVPVITYGFDQSFLDYFGTNGVAAVESAIQMLNDLPPASQIVLSNYPFVSARINYSALATNLLDLKSTALVLLVEQMGLAQPTRFIYTLHDFSYVNDQTNYTVIMRNFDPVSLAPTDYANNLEYGFAFTVDGIDYSTYIRSYSELPLTYVDASEFLFDPSDHFASAVADGETSFEYASAFAGDYPDGNFFISLTRDDVGGLAYLWSTNTVSLENLINGVSGVGPNSNNYVATALRPGRDKITLQPHDFDSLLGTFLPMTNQFTDYYVSNGVIQTQTLQRLIAKPDILFTAKYDGLHAESRTGTTNWANNGLPSSDGPGVIQPPVVINFNQVGPSLYHVYGDYTNLNNYYPLFNTWGSFNGTTNPPVVYPIPPAATNATIFYLWLHQPNEQPDIAALSQEFSWSLTGDPNQLFSFQTSTNLSDWTTITTITNLGGTFTFLDNMDQNTSARFYRTIPQ